MTTDNERKAFEAWAIKAGWDEAFLAEYDAADNRYLNIPLNDMWFGWQARAEQDGWLPISEEQKTGEMLFALVGGYPALISWLGNEWKFMSSRHPVLLNEVNFDSCPIEPKQYLPLPPKQGGNSDS